MLAPLGPGFTIQQCVSLVPRTLNWLGVDFSPSETFTWVQTVQRVTQRLQKGSFFPHLLGIEARRRSSEFRLRDFRGNCRNRRCCFHGFFGLCGKAMLHVNRLLEAAIQQCPGRRRVGGLEWPFIVARVSSGSRWVKVGESSWVLSCICFKIEECPEQTGYTKEYTGSQKVYCRTMSNTFWIGLTVHLLSHWNFNAIRFSESTQEHDFRTSKQWVD